MHKYDILSEIFDTLRLRSALYFHAHLGGPFALALSAEQKRIRFHLVLKGHCWIQLTGQNEALLLREGQMILIPHGAQQDILQRPDIAPVPLERVLSKGALKEPGILTYIPAPSAPPPAPHHNVQKKKIDAADQAPEHISTRLLCGFCHFDEAIEHPLLAHLPDAIILQPEQLGANPWLSTALRLLTLEAERGAGALGADAILTRLLEIILIQSLSDNKPDIFYGQSNKHELGYLKALTDPSLGKSLQAMHQAPEKSWTIAELAQLAGMSRASFAERFKQKIGAPPYRYLTQWRLIKARALLRERTYSIEEIAERCGYRSLPSFSRQFKRAFGQGPGHFRRRSNQ